MEFQGKKKIFCPLCLPQNENFKNSHKRGHVRIFLMTPVLKLKHLVATATAVKRGFAVRV